MKHQSITVGAFQENTYLVIDEATNRAVLIDPGDEPDRIIAMVEQSGAELEAIWLTHAHIDHVGGIAGVRRRWPVPVHMHPADRPVLDGGEETAAEYGVAFEPPELPEHEVAEGTVMSLGSLTFDVLHTPGHSPGHVLYKHGTTIFGGDLLFAGSIGRTDLRHGDPDAMEESLARIAELVPATTFHPGHGPSTTVAVERMTNPFLSGVARVLKRR